MSIKQTDIYTCPHCGLISPINSNTFRELYFSFGKIENQIDYDPIEDDIHDLDNSQDLFRVEIKRCEQCSRDAVSTTCICGPSRGLSVQISPKTIVKKYPEYIPLAIRQDYEEARAIADLSPKAAATLARRCLQGIIRDFWAISRNRLVEEIGALEGLIEPKLWQAMDDIRNIGNIGAHMESDVNYIIDVDINEAEIILDVIDHILEVTYIAREKTDKILENLHTVSKEKLTLKETHKKTAPSNDGADRTVPSAAITGKQGMSKQEQDIFAEQGKKLVNREENLKDLQI